MSEHDQWLTLYEAAKYLNIDSQMVNYYARQLKIVRRKIKYGNWYHEYSLKSLKKFKSNHKPIRNKKQPRSKFRTTGKYSNNTAYTRTGSTLDPSFDYYPDIVYHNGKLFF